jgi:hypothetical protein
MTNYSFYLYFQHGAVQTYEVTASQNASRILIVYERGS